MGKRLGESSSSRLGILALLAASGAALQQPGAELCVCCPLQAKSAPDQACHCSLHWALGAELAQCLGGSGEHYLGSCKNCASECTLSTGDRPSPAGDVLEALSGSSRRHYAVGFVLSRGLMDQLARGGTLDVLKKNRG